MHRPVHRPVHRTVCETHLFLVFQTKKKHTPQTPFSIQGQRHPYAAYKRSIQGAIQGGNPIVPQPHKSSVSNLPTVYLATQLQNECSPDRVPVLGMLLGLSTVCNLDEGVSPIAGEKNPLQ